MTTVSTNDLLDSWIDINAAIADGSPFMVNRLREKHVALFGEPDQADASERFVCITNSTSQTFAAESVERATKRSVAQEIKKVAA